MGTSKILLMGDYWEYDGTNEFVEFLLTKGVNINALDQSRYTPLHFAVCINDKVIVELLLKAGAGIDIVDKEGLTPLDYAINMGYEEVIKIYLWK